MKVIQKLKFKKDKDGIGVTTTPLCVFLCNEICPSDMQSIYDIMLNPKKKEANDDGGNKTNGNRNNVNGNQ